MDAPGNDGYASMPEQVKRPNPWRKIIIIIIIVVRGEFRPRQTRQLPTAVDLKGRLLSCQSY